MVEDNPLTYRDKNSIAEIYHCNTKLNKLNSKQYGLNIESKKLYLSNLSKPYKSYPYTKKIQLNHSFETNTPIEKLLIKRRSMRNFIDKNIEKHQLSSILKYSAGITTTFHDSNNNNISFRAYPSGGALYPLEIYLMSYKVHNLEKGLYHYNASGHYLEKIGLGFGKDELKEIVFTDGMEHNVSVVFFITSIFYRNMVKYGERGYRIILIEVGHLAQNIILTSIANKLNVCPIAGFLDDEINDKLNIDGIEETVQYVLMLGKK
jgi:SagB-type dehydrogenase family enzyme